MNIPKPKPVHIAICLGLFLLFTLFLFPFQNLKGYLFGQIYKNTGILIIADEIYPSIFGWPGLGMKNVNISLPMGRDELDITAESMVVRVGLGSLFPPGPSLSLSIGGMKQGGDLYVKLSKSGSITDAYVEAEDVQLSQLNFPGVSGSIQGVVNAEGDFNIDQETLSGSTGSLKLDIAKVNVPPQNIPAFPLPQFKFDKVDANITMKNGVAQINKFELGDEKSDFSGRILGSVQLGKTLEMSALDLKVYFKATEGYRNDPNASALISLLGGYERAPGDYGMGVKFRFLELRTNPLAALPTKMLN